MPGFIADRLLEALWREALHLVNEGVATTGEIDDAIRFGAGIRWSFGHVPDLHARGRRCGHATSCSSSAPRSSCRGRSAPTLTDALIDSVVEGTTEQQGTRSIKELERYRDECITEVLKSIAAVKARHGCDSKTEDDRR